MAGVPLLVVARNLGHADTCMVEHHYGHLTHAGVPRYGVAPSKRVVPLL